MENIETLLAAVAQTQGFDDDEPAVSTAPELKVENFGSGCDIRLDVSASQMAGVVSGDARPSAVVGIPPPATALAYPAVGRMIGLEEKRKRGRPSRGQLVAKPPPSKRPKVEDEEEDVCFICFDGGSLVLCDRKGCPKAYHPACIKRDEAFFKSKAKWTCGWHICSVCQKASYYMCYTCTYSLCKGCTKDADYVSVRGNKGFCSTCMKTIMLIENKDQANSESVQVDFDDQTSWEYLFKVYWVYLKEKLSLTLSELTQAKNPWKGVAAVAGKPQLSNVLHTVVDRKVSISYRSTEHLELNKPRVEISLSQNDGIRTVQSSIDNHVEKLNSDRREDGPSHSKDTVELNTDKVTDDPSIDKTTNKLVIKETTEKPDIDKDLDTQSVVKNTDKSCICRSVSNKVSDKPAIDCSTEWASNDLLEFVAHMKNGDASPISQFDVQTLLLDYIKRNNLRDPRRKSQIICDLRLKNLFGKPRVGHIEMLKLLEFHFLRKEDSEKNSFIPAGIVSSVASNMEVDENIYGLRIPSNNRKRKMRRKIEERAPQNNLNEYAGIDVHNINLIYLRRHLMENLIEDHENFNDKVVGSVVRIRVSSNDQKQDVYRLVQVVGTSKVAEPYKIGDRTADVMLEVLNLDKKEIVSIDAISNQEFTEDECRRLRQSIRCGLVKRFTVGEIQKKAMALQPVRVNDWLEAEILRLNHLRDRASEKGRKKELRELVDKLQLLKSPEERQRRISEVPEIHADPKMSPNYESEEDTNIDDNARKDEYLRPGYLGFPRNGRKPVSPNKKGKEVRAVQMQNRIIEKTDAGESHSSNKCMNQVNITNSAIGGRSDIAMQRSGLEASTSTASVGDSRSPDNIETEKLWHYRDPNGKIQGPFSMMQLRKWSTTGLFPPEMRIWTNHEQFDSLLLTDTLNGKFHGASGFSYKPSLRLQESGATRRFAVSECTKETGRDTKQTDTAACNNVSISSDKKTGVARAGEPGSSRPQCLDLLKDNNSRADDVEARNLLPSSGIGQTYVHLPDRAQESDDFNRDSQSVDKNSTGLTETPITAGNELQNQSKNEERMAVSSEENVGPLNIDLSSNDMEPAAILSPVSKLPDSSKQSGNMDVFDLPSPTPKTPESQQPLPSDVPVQNSSILELLSPTPRFNGDYQEGQVTETKQGGSINLSLPHSDPSWSGASTIVVGGMQLQEVADDWCGYSLTPAKPSVQEWDSGIASASSKPPEVTSENITTLTPGNDNPSSNTPNWLSSIHEPIEFDVLGEESVSDLLAEVDALESSGVLPSPTSAMKFARELMEDCKDDCFSSIEDFSPIPDPQKSDAFSATGEIQLTSQSSEPCKPIESSPIDAFDFFRRSSGHSSASSEGETNPPVYSGDSSSEFHPPAPIQELVGATMAPDTTDPGWGTVQGNINLVTVQGNVNLVLGGPAQGMANLGWGTSQGISWSNPSINRSPVNLSLPWDGQRKYGERFNSPREWGYQGRLPWGRQPYGGGYNRPLPKGQRVCKFYESGHCKKGALCNYLHP